MKKENKDYKSILFLIAMTILLLLVSIVEFIQIENLKDEVALLEEELIIEEALVFNQTHVEIVLNFEEDKMTILVGEDTVIEGVPITGQGTLSFWHEVPCVGED